MRIVASISAVDSNEKELVKIIENLTNQSIKFDVIYITVKKGQVIKICDNCLSIELDPKYRKFAKIYGPLIYEEGDTIIVSVDPKRTYDTNFVKNLIKGEAKVSEDDLIFPRNLLPSMKDLLKCKSLRGCVRTVPLAKELGTLHTPDYVSLDEINGGRLLFLIVIIVIIAGIYYSL